MNKRKKRIYLVLIIGLLFIFTGCSRNFCNDTDRANIRTMYRNKTIIYLTDLALENNTGASETTIIDYIKTDDTFITDTNSKINYSLLKDDFKVNNKSYLEKLDNEFYVTIYTNESLITFVTDNAGKLSNVAKAIVELYDKQKSTMSCMTINNNDVEANSGASITKKTWGDALKLGPLEVAFVYPLSALLIFLTNIFGSNGIGQLIAIIVTTFLIRLLVLALTFKSTIQSQKMTAIQPEIKAMQDKYQGATDQASKEKMSQEMMKIYAKHGVNPLTSMIAPFMTMPVFVAVYHAVSQTAILKAGTIFNLTLGTTLSDAISRDWNWFAIVLFVLMIITQFVTMKLPQYLNKLKATKSKRYVDPKTLKTQGSANMIMYVFLVMIVVMGWMMPAAMTVYWIASSIVSITQTVIINKYTSKQNKKKG